MTQFKATNQSYKHKNFTKGNNFYKVKHCREEETRFCKRTGIRTLHTFTKLDRHNQTEIRQIQT